MSDKTVALSPARTVPGTILWAIALSLVLVASARIQVPFWSVPMTMQTLAVLAIAGFAGPRLAWAALAAYVLEGAAGLPVFAGTGAGPAYLAGPTAGYIAGFFLAAGLAGWAGGRFATRAVPLFACMVAAAALIYVPGVAWLATFVGWSRAIAVGAVPFLLADLVKAALATALVLAAAGWRRRV